MSNTIFALSTPPGKSAVAIIRITGNDALSTIKHLGVKATIASRVATFTAIYDDHSNIIDNVLILYFPSPNSFTGEDIVEIQCHGSKAVTQLILKELGKYFQGAKPGEFSKRAFFNGKMDLTQAEGLSDLIEAETEMQAKQALRQISGKLRNLCQKWSEELLHTVAHVETYLDFPEEDISTDEIDGLNAKIDRITQEINTQIHNNTVAIKDGFYVPIIGLPNAGKSTLFNHYAQQDMAIISNIAGTTRDIIEVTLNINGYPVTLADTAGLRESNNEIEIQGIKKAQEKAKTADLKIALISHNDLPEIPSILREMIGENTICVASKVDTLHIDAILVEDINFIPISVHNEIGLEKLSQALSDRISNLIPMEPSSATHKRHVDALQQTVLSLQEIHLSQPMEITAENIHNALRSINSLTGITTIEDVLDIIFSKFCIGK